MRLVSLFAFGFCLLHSSAYAEESLYKPDVINEEKQCDDPSGNEANRTVIINAPSGKFFQRETIDVIAERDFRSFSDAAGKSGCFLKDTKFQRFPIVTKHHTVNINVVTSFEVYGHSDCGSGTLQAMRGNKIRTHCSLKAQLYSNEDFKK